METLSEIRAAIDATDRSILDMIRYRFELIEKAADIKNNRSHVYDAERIITVITNATKYASQIGIPPKAYIQEIWEILVNAAIDYEYGCWDKKHLSK